MTGWQVAKLDEIPRAGKRWIPIRKHFDGRAFGVNAWVAEAEGEDVIGEHIEEGTGHEELYFVARGAATFALDGESVHAPAGTYVFLPDPTTQRHATADEPGTTVLSFGGWRDRAFQVSGWESRMRATTIREDDPQRARELYEEGLASDQDSKWANYDLACWHALYGDEEEARRLLGRAIELGGDEVREHAAKDPDLENLRAT